MAAEAGVSAEFGYKNVGPKGALVAAVLDVAVGGDDEPVALAEGNSVTRLRELTSASEVLVGYVQVLLPVQECIVKIELVEIKDVEIPESMQRAMAREAEAVREKRARLIKADAERLAGMTALAQHLHHLGGLRVGLDAGRTRDCGPAPVRSCTTCW